MRSPDFGTLLFAFGIVSLASLYFLIKSWWQNRYRYSGLLYFVHYWALQIVGTVLLLMRNYVPLWASVSLGTGIIDIGVILLVLSLSSFSGQRLSQAQKTFLTALLALDILAGAYCTFIVESLISIVVIHSIFVAACSLIGLGFLHRATDPVLKIVTRDTAFALAFFVSVDLGRLVATIIFPETINNYLQVNSLGTILLLLYLAANVFLCFTLVLMVNRRLLLEAERAEKKAKEGEIYFASLVEDAPDMIVRFDTNLRHVYCNPAVERQLGMPKEFFLGKSPLEVSGPTQESDFITKSLARVLETGQGLECEQSMPTPTGVKHFLTRIVPEFDGREKVKSLLAITRDITRRKQAEEAQSQSEARFRTFFETSPIAIELYDEEGRLIQANTACLKMFGVMDIQKLQGFSLLEDPQFAKEKARALQKGEEVSYQTLFNFEKIESRGYYVSSRSGIAYLDVIITRLDLSENEPNLGYLVQVQEITARQQAEDRIKASLAEKEVLLKEIQHRVKNNLQVVYGLLMLQSRSFKDAAALKAFKESEDRVQSMALVYSHLYESEDLANISLKSYVAELVSRLLSSYPLITGRVKVNTHIDDIRLDVSIANPCALILNELLTNAFRHAFPEANKGTVSVNIRKNECAIRIEVADDGIGLPADFDLSKCHTLGMELLSALVKHQLGGKLEAKNEGGAIFSIDFPLARGSESRVLA